MSVYTELNNSEMAELLSQYSLGNYVSHQGISAGVENTNYFVNTDEHELVLTIFEKHSADELPFFLNLGSHLFNGGCPVPQPFRCSNGDLLKTVKGKPAVFFERVKGGHVNATEAHAIKIAHALAQIHNSTANFTESNLHSHGLDWIEYNAEQFKSLLPAEDQKLLTMSLEKLQHLPDGLPKGVIHADLFHDNALFHNGDVSGVIDWYFAGVDSYALDIAITMNDWCLGDYLENEPETDVLGHISPRQVASFIEAYQKIRPLTETEQLAIPLLQVQSALRFWLSRLIAKQQHVSSDEKITVKDPSNMKNLLLDLLSYT